MPSKHNADSHADRNADRSGENDLRGQLLVVVDYNLTRIGDVRLITRYAHERYGLRSVLIRPLLQPHDHELADFALDLDPLAPGFAHEAAARVRALGIPVAGVLPFSDNAVQTGALVAALLGSRADSPELAAAAFSKQVYREQERSYRALFAASGVHVPRFALIHDEAALRCFLDRCPEGAVLKPTCEGNNRGVIHLRAGDDLAAALAENAAYLDQGLICEEYIGYPEEYSFDGIGHLSFVTKKLSASGRYPVEQGQVVGLPLPTPTVAALTRAGTLANLVCGQRLGPFHNEIRFDPATGQAAVIEPNRRPGGMSIWHLAGRVFGCNLFHLWVDQIVAQALPQALPAPRGTAAIRLLPAPQAMTVPSLPASTWAQTFDGAVKIADRWDGAAGVTFFDFQIIAAPGQHLPAIARDNSHFLAQVSAYSPDQRPALLEALDMFQKAWLALVCRVLPAPGPSPSPASSPAPAPLPSHSGLIRPRSRQHVQP